jgi:hypothetical protein
MHNSRPKCGLKVRYARMGSVGAQKMIPQSVVVWRSEFFELKKIGRPQKQPQNQGLSTFFPPVSYSFSLLQAQGKAFFELPLSNYR